MGKIPGKILEIGKRKGIPVIAIAGCVEDEEMLLQAGFRGVYSTKPQNMPLEEAMKKDVAIRNIKRVLPIVI
jgi:glycerate kinase